MNLAKFILMMALASTSYGQEQSGLCEDLGKFSCSPGVQSDGTGVSIKGDDIRTRLGPFAAFESKKEIVRNKFKKLLNDPENVYFKKLAVSAFGLAEAPACQSQAAADVAKCSEDTIAGLVELAQRDMLGTSGSGGAGQKSKLFRSGEDLSEKRLVLQNVAFKKTVSELEKEIGLNLGKPEIETKIKEKVFPQVKALLEKRVKELPIEDKMKSFMVEKIRGIQYGGTDCEEMGAGLSKNFIPNAFYHPEKQIFKVCKGLIAETSSDFHLVGVIAHELAHSIDPCDLTIGPQSETMKYKNKKDLDKMDREYPIQGLLSCLRSKKSIHAVNFRAAQLKMQGMMALPQGPQYPQTPQIPPSSDEDEEEQEAAKEFSYCGNQDQIGESVSDWFAAEILTDYIQGNYPQLSKEQWQMGYSNVFRPICDDRSSRKMDVHPEVQDRINRLILANPSVRQKMGCAKPHSKYVYCDAKNPELLLKMADEENAKKLKTQENTGMGMGMGGYGIPAVPPNSKTVPQPKGTR